VAKDRLSTLDTKRETSDLEEAEVAELLENLHSMSPVQASMCWKKARLNWLQEGDSNTKFFYGVMSSKRRCNTLQSIQVNDVQVEGV